MTYKWNEDYNRFAIARNILLQIVDSIYAVNNEVEFGVRLYGTEYPAQDKNCTDSKLRVRFNLQNVNQIKQSLKYTEPIGWSPIAYSLQQAAFGEINNVADYDYSIIFITDGGESCGGDICKTYKELLEKKVSVTPYIIGLDKNELLKGYYACLGKFVPVLEVADISKAVKLIVDENRPILNKETNLNLTTVFSNSPIKKTTTSPKKVVKQVVKKEVVVEPKKEVVQVEVKPKPPVAKERVYDVFPAMKSLTPIKRYVVVGKWPAGFIAPLFNKVELVVNFDEVAKAAPRRIDVFPRMKPFAPRYRMVYAYRTPIPVRVLLPFDKIEYNFAYTPIKRDTVLAQIPKATPKKAVVSNMPVGKPNTTVSREVIPSDETMVQVYFVNKFQKNRSYKNATPTIIIQDAATKQQVGKFIRSTTRGEPDQKKLKAGTYNFIVKGDSRIMTPNVRIDANNVNKVTIFVQDGTIQFAYEKNPKRPVKEFQAIVNRRFEKGSTIIQECRDKLDYPPGTYYIEINTLPVWKSAMNELGFGEIKELRIPEPGWLQINNENRLGKVEFTHPLNDADARFHTVNVKGNVADQKIMMLPGNYKAVFLINPSVPALGTKTVPFRVESNEVTQLLLE